MIFIKRLSQTVKMPERKHYDDSGVDIYMPEAGSIEPGEFQLIDTKLAVEFPWSFGGHMRARSSLFMKGLLVDGTIDAGYRGEVKIMAWNIGKETIQWNKHDRIAQMVTECVNAEGLEIEETHDLGASVRSIKGFGGTGR